MNNEILLIPENADKERDELAKIWEENGGQVKRIGRFWIKPETGNKRISIYGNDSFCLVLAQVLEVELEMVRDEVIGELPKEYLKRKVEIKGITEISAIDFPKFIKSATPKLFKAAIFKSENALRKTIDGIEASEKLICSEIIKVEKEVRSFILDKEIKDLAFYEGKGDLKEPELFINNFLIKCKIELPKTFVLDLGYNKKNGWFIIEFNSSWGAGLNYCKPEKIVHCIREATLNKN